MNPKIKEWIRLETKELIKLNNSDFDTNFIYFEQLIELDVAIKGIDGLSERMAFPLEKIATNKLDRNDIILYFPSVWNCFEVFAKKTLYIINRNEYLNLSKRKSSSITDYLNSLGFPVFVDSKLRTNNSDIIYSAYKYRNIESHEIRLFSIMKFYEILDTILSACLIIIDENINKLKNNSSSVKFVIPECKDFNLINIANGWLRKLNNLNYLNNINEITILDKNTTHKTSFNQNGLPICSNIIGNEYSYFSSYKHEFKNGLLTRTIISVTQTFKNDTKTLSNEYIDYEYNHLGKLSCIIIKNNSNRLNLYFKKNEYEINYCGNGNIQVIRKDWDLNRVNNELKLKHKVIFTYNSNGALLLVEHDNDKTIYIYNEVGNLIEFKTNNNVLSVISLENTLYILKNDYINNSSTKLEKWIFKNNKPSEIIYYKDVDQKNNFKFAEEAIIRKVKYKYY